MFFDKITPHGICVAPRDLWANSPTCFFKRIGRLVVSHRSLRFAQMFFLASNFPHAKESVPIRRAAGAICVFDNHPAWHLCRSCDLWAHSPISLFKRHRRIVSPADLTDLHRFSLRLLWLRTSLPPVGRWVYDKSREISNTGGVSSQWSFVRFV